MYDHSYDNPHLMRLDNGNRVLVDVKAKDEERALVSWERRALVVKSERLQEIDPDHVLPHHG